MRLSKLLTILLSLLALIAVTSTAQEKARAPRTPTGLALEISFRKDAAPTYNEIIREKMIGGWFGRFDRIPNWQLPDGQLPVRAVNINSRLDADLVVITVSVLRGVKFHDEETSVGKYELREEESISVTELQQFGVEPFRLKVVRITPSVSPQPIVKSHAKSLEVVGIEPVSATLPTYKLTLHNLSDKNISAFEINIVDGSKVVVSSWPHGPDGLPIIKAGGFYESGEPLLIRAQRTAAGYGPSVPDSQQTVISCVIFEDGSYEGDAKTAAELRAMTLGRKLALTRLLEVFATRDRTLPAAQELSAQLNWFRGQVLAVSEVADRTTLAGLEKEFPNVELNTQEGPKQSLENHIHFVKRDLLDDLDGIAKTPSFDISSFREWLNKTEKRYRSWHSRL
ncbi:MAG: hypothetical protein ACR2H4_14750 [Pyrinomonadaceae bacterium]